MTRSVFLDAYDTMLVCLVSARKQAGITQTALANRLGRPQSFVSKFENGDRRIDMIEFLEICRSLDADPLEIVNTIWASLNVH